MKEIKEGKWAFIISFAKNNFLGLSGAVVAGLFANLVIVLIPVSLGKYFDLLFGFQSHRAAFLDQLPFSFWENIEQYLGFLTLLIVGKTILQYLQRFQTSKLGEGFVKTLREQLFRQQLKIESQIYDDRGRGRYLLRHSGDLRSIQNYFTKGVIRFSIDVLLLLFSLFFLWHLNQGIFLIILAGFLLTAIVVFFLNRILYRVSVKRRNDRSGVLSFVNRQLQAVKTVKAFNKSNTEIKKYNHRSSKLYEDGIRFQRIYNVIFVLVPGLLYMTLVAVLYFIHYSKEQASGSFNAGNMLGFIFLFITILPVFRRVIRVSTVWELGNISFFKLAQIFQLPAKENKGQGKEFTFIKGEIEFKNVTFYYSPTQLLFSNLSLQIRPKSINQIKVRNSGGKTSLIRLLSGLYIPQEGEIYFDGQQMSELDIKSLRANTTFVSEEFPLLGSSVFEAVSYSRREEKRKKAKKLLDAFQLHVPPELELKLSDKIVEGGGNLSKSQVKMLQYVRAALSGKPIVIIEEPTRNLERNTRKNVLRWIKRQAAKKTIVLLCQSWKEASIELDHVVEIKHNYSDAL